MKTKKKPSQIPDDLLNELLGATKRKRITVSDVEDLLEDLKDRLGQQGIDKVLSELGPEDDQPQKCPRCGRLVPVHTKKVERTFESLSGTHTIARNYHYCGHCKFGFYPRDEEIGLPAEGNVSFNLEQRILDFGVNDPFEQCAERWSVHYPNRSFSSNMFRRVVKRVGYRLTLADEQILQQECLRPTSGRKDLLYVLNDGSMLPQVGGTWKEAKVGVLFSSEMYRSHRHNKRGCVSQARYVAVWGEQPEFKEAMRCALNAERSGRYRQTVWLGDGARGNWILAEELSPLAQQILDIGHAIENGVDCGKAMLGEQDSLLPVWQRRIEQLIKHGNVNQLIAELMECLSETTTDKQIASLNSVVGYYRHNESRMNYPEYLAAGLMIGSGVVESAHRHVLQSRMKRAGQHWSDRFGRQMVRLRAAYRTAGPRRFHRAINRAAYRTRQYGKPKQLRLVA